MKSILKSIILLYILFSCVGRDHNGENKDITQNNFEGDDIKFSYSLDLEVTNDLVDSVNMFGYVTLKDTSINSKLIIDISWLNLEKDNFTKDDYINTLTSQLLSLYPNILFEEDSVLARDLNKKIFSFQLDNVKIKGNIVTFLHKEFVIGMIYTDIEQNYSNSIVYVNDIIESLDSDG